MMPLDDATNKKFTSKQMGDACEMLIAAELTLAGIPALKVPDNWPGYDVIAQPPNDWPGYDTIAQPDHRPQRIQVKSRTYKKGGGNFISYPQTSGFEWLAVVLLQCPSGKRRVFLIPREVAEKRGKLDGPNAKTNERYWPIEQTEKLFSEFEDNFTLGRHEGTTV